MRVVRRTQGLVAAFLCMTGAELTAQSVPFLGSTSGCFFTTGPCAPTSTATLYELTFNAGSFDAWTSSVVQTSPGVYTSQLTLGGSANNLGRFTLGGMPATYTGKGWNFLLNIAFQLPTLADPDAVYTAAIAGIVVDDDLGGAHILFDGAPRVFTFNGPTQSGYFSLVVPKFDVWVGQTAPITGNIQATVTPEPATMTLLVTGLAGLIPAARWRRRKSTKVTPSSV